MKTKEIAKTLAQPFPASDVEWRLQHTNGEKTSGLAVPYIDSRAIQNRLDDVMGPFNWQNAFIPWQNNAQLCGISLYCEERSEWITKYDGSPNSDIEAVKGGLSDACKRAAVQWGIGRYLYGMDGVWVDVEQRGKSYVIKRGEQKKLDEAYNKAVAQHLSGSGTPPPQSTPKAPKTEKPKASEKTADSEKPANPPVGSNDKVTPFPTHYMVTAAKSSNNGSGVSTTLDLTDPQGNPIRAYLRGENPGLKAGDKLKELSLTEKTGSYGQYFIVNEYQIAA
jgi:hypothetical protein